jgi:peptide chain release factor 2
LPGKKQQMEELDRRMSAPDFWVSQEAAQKVVGQLKALKAVVAPVSELLKQADDVQALVELAMEDDTPEMFSEASAEIEKLQAHLESVELRTLLGGPHDAGNCYFSIHAGAGGTESCDWAEMLLRMYLRYFERSGYSAEEYDRTNGEEAGIRSITLRVSGPYAHGYLSCERGVHRLVRISPFDSQKRRHTSFASVDVSPELDELEVNVDWDKDVREDTFCASGAGGQHVNKTASAVRVTHLATGISVQCQNERSQHKNRAECRKMLAAKLYQLEQIKRDAELSKMYGAKGEIAFGYQIRSYVLYPYQLVRDERTDLKSSQTDKVLDGDIQEFIDSYLRYSAGKTARK